MKLDFLRRKDCILGDLGQAEFDIRLGFDPDRLACGRITAHAGFAPDFDKLSKSGNGEARGGLCAFVRHGEQGFESGLGLYFRDLRVVGDFGDDLGFGSGCRCWHCATPFGWLMVS